MPNTGKPSLDCQLCRQRRVKCDLGRPKCWRCIKYGVECPGYRDLQELVFRNVSPATMEKRRKRQQQISETEKEDAALLVLPTHSTHPLTHHKTDPMPLITSLSEHWTAHSLPILLNIFSLDFIESIYRDFGSTKGGGGSPLTWAAHVFARTCIINVRNPTCVRRDARSETQQEVALYLGKALNSVSEALGTEGGVRRDDVFVTVWILASYELLVGSLGSRPTENFNSWHLHTRGLCSMLRSRGAEHIYTPNGRATFWPAYTMIQAECLITATPLPPESEHWLQIIQESLYPGEGFALAMSEFIRVVSTTQCRVLDILRRRDHVAAGVECQDLFEGMVLAQRRLQEYVEGRREEEFHHDSYLYLVNLRRSACVKGFHVMQLLINFLTHHHQHEDDPHPSRAQLLTHRAHCLQQVRTAAQEILDSAPTALGKDSKQQRQHEFKSLKSVFEGLKITWPLIAVLTMPSSLPEQRVAARENLVYIGRELGVRQALGVKRAMNLYEDEERWPLPGEAHEPAM